MMQFSVLYFFPYFSPCKHHCTFQTILPSQPGWPWMSLEFLHQTSGLRACGRQWAHIFRGGISTKCNDKLKCFWMWLEMVRRYGHLSLMVERDLFHFLTRNKCFFIQWGFSSTIFISLCALHKLIFQQEFAVKIAASTVMFDAHEEATPHSTCLHTLPASPVYIMTMNIQPPIHVTHISSIYSATRRPWHHRRFGASHLSRMGPRDLHRSCKDV